MNLQQAKITLEKINRLYQSMTLDSSIDEHEQQLMLNYIRQFYKPDPEPIRVEKPVREYTAPPVIPISINEKILTCNELFGKDKNRFNDALTTLNGFGSFTEARPYLVSLANEFGWDQKNAKKKAQVFIKLVRRRYK